MNWSYANVFNLDLSTILSFGPDLILYQTTNFLLSQIERICRRQNTSDSKIKVCYRKGKNTAGKEKMLLPSIFSYFHNVFKKASFTKPFKVRIVWKRVKNTNQEWQDIIYLQKYKKKSHLSHKSHKSHHNLYNIN